MTILVPAKFFADDLIENQWIRSYEDYRAIRLYIYYQRHHKTLLKELEYIHRTEESRMITRRRDKSGIQRAINTKVRLGVLEERNRNTSS